ncbi:MAG: hypothetical protein ACRDD1_19585 [Planctomycetia bacterium]
MTVKLKFRCPNCDAKLSAGSKHAGKEVRCPGCTAPLIVPPVTILVAAKPRTLAPHVADAESVERRAAERPKLPKAEPTPVEPTSAELTPIELRLPGQLGGLKANVDRKTSNMMATTTLGALLFAGGAVLFAMLGGKARSA